MPHEPTKMTLGAFPVFMNESGFIKKEYKYLHGFSPAFTLKSALSSHHTLYFGVANPM